MSSLAAAGIARHASTSSRRRANGAFSEFSTWRSGGGGGARLPDHRDRRPDTAACRRRHPFLVSIGQIRAVEPRRRAFELVKSANGKFATIVSPLAYVSPTAVVGAGTIVMHRALVNSSAVIGDNVIINTLALIEHDAMVGSHSHISTAAIVNGGATIGSGCFVGSNAAIVQGATVPDEAFVPAGILYRKQEG